LKDAVIAALLADLRAELARLEQINRMAVDEATSAESKAENKYDTRATEASYLAAGQGQRVLAMQRLVNFLEGPAAVDLYELEGGRWFLLAPDGGGRRVRVGEADVVVVTADSPVGAVLANASEGDAVRIGARELEIVAIT
jgi:hypothetical protein